MMETDELKVVCLETSSKQLSLSLIPGHGLTFHKLLASGYDVLIGPEDPICLRTEPRKFNNQIIGRYANRLPAGLNKILDSDSEKLVTINLEETSMFCYFFEIGIHLMGQEIDGDI